MLRLNRMLRPKNLLTLFLPVLFILLSMSPVLSQKRPTVRPEDSRPGFVQYAEPPHPVEELLYGVGRAIEREGDIALAALAAQYQMTIVELKQFGRSLGIEFGAFSREMGVGQNFRNTPDRPDAVSIESENTSDFRKIIPQVMGWKEELDPLSKVLKLRELEDRLDEEDMSAKCGGKAELPEPSKSIVQRAKDIDFNYKVTNLMTNEENRFKRSCLRALKMMVCDQAPPSAFIINRKLGPPKECKDKGGYAPTGSANDYPAHLKRKGWKNIYCPGKGVEMTPGNAPVGTMICYNAIDGPEQKPKDVSVNDGHCEVKVSNCRFCYDGCKTKPRTGDLSENKNRGNNREIMAMMVPPNLVGKNQLECEPPKAKKWDLKTKKLLAGGPADKHLPEPTKKKEYKSIRDLMQGEGIQ